MSALAVVIAIAVLLFVASMLVLAASDRLDRRDQARREAGRGPAHRPRGAGAVTPPRPSDTPPADVGERAPTSHATDWCAAGLLDDECDCWDDGEPDPALFDVDELDHLIAVFRPPWITVTPRSEYL